MTDEMEIIKGSDNPFRDIGIPNADAALMKANLAAEIIAILDRRKLTIRSAGKLVGMAHSDISDIRNAKLKRYSVERLVRVLNALDCRVEVKITRLRGTTAA